LQLYTGFPHENKGIEEEQCNSQKTDINLFRKWRSDQAKIDLTKQPSLIIVE
jgi:hypothetical protein